MDFHYYYYYYYYKTDQQASLSDPQIFVLVGREGKIFAGVLLPTNLREVSGGGGSFDDSVLCSLLQGLLSLDAFDRALGY